METKKYLFKLNMLIALIVVLLGGFKVFPVQAAENNAVPDPVFRATLNQLLGRSADTPITKTELGGMVGPAIAQGLYSFPFLANKGIKNFEGVQYLNPRNVFFDFSGNEITDWEPIVAIPNLWFLQARNAHITSLEALGNIDSLQGLIVDDNQITSLEPLKNNRNLTQLSVVNNQITSLNGLETLTELTDFTGTGNQITDYSGIANSTKIKRFNVEGFSFSATTKGPFQILANSSNLTDLSFMEHWENMTKLGVAILKNNPNLVSLSGLNNATALSGIQIDNSPQLADLSALANSANLTMLVLNAEAGEKANTKLTSLAGLEGKPNLNGVQIVNFPALKDISALSESTNIVNLKLEQTGITSFAALANMTKLDTIEATNSRIADVSGLSNATSLVNLVLDHNQLSDLSPLAGLTNLRKLSFNHNQVKKLKGLENLTNLQDIYAANNQIDDLTGIPIKTYRYFFFDNNKITDVTPIKGVRSTNHIDLAGNQIADISALSLQGNYNDPSGDSANQWVNMPRQNPVIPVNVDATRTLTVKNPLRGFTSSAWDQLLHPNDPNSEQTGDKAAKVLPYYDAPIRDESQWGWEKYANEYPAMEVSYNEEDDTITFKNIPADATELKYDFSKNYWTGANGVHYTPFSGTVHLVINNLPVISAKDRVITEGSSFDPLEGVSAQDREDGVLKLDLSNVIENLVQPEVPGIYTVTYEAKDSNGAKTRKTVTIRVNAKPIITAKDREIEVGESFDPLAGVSAQDREDGEISLTLANVEFFQNGEKISQIDTKVAGEYQLVYRVTDKDGASGTITVSLKVKAKPIEPEKPVVPNKPVTPEKPTEPEKPVVPPVKEQGTKPETVANRVSENYLPNSGSSSGIVLLFSLLSLGIATAISVIRKPNSVRR